MIQISRLVFRYDSKKSITYAVIHEKNVNKPKQHLKWAKLTPLSGLLVLELDSTTCGFKATKQVNLEMERLKGNQTV